MPNQKLINKTIEYIKLLPEEKLEEISDYIEFIFHKYEDELIKKGISKIITKTDSFKFLEDEEDLYSLSDLKEKY